jgi:hypothetical protein
MLEFGVAWTRATTERTEGGGGRARREGERWSNAKSGKKMLKGFEKREHRRRKREERTRKKREGVN